MSGVGPVVNVTSWSRRRVTTPNGEIAVTASIGCTPLVAEDSVSTALQRADEALGELEAFLDRTALEGADTVFIIHGHGTGALRKVVREYLATSPYVERFRPGGTGEGGDGVSVVSLRG